MDRLDLLLWMQVLAEVLVGVQVRCYARWSMSSPWT
jgi:hypothetical protein